MVNKKHRNCLKVEMDSPSMEDKTLKEIVRIVEGQKSEEKPK